ncbi:MAG: AAA family ATPase [Planctomycetota bacterium]
MKIKDIQIDGFGVWSGLTVHSMPDTMTVFYGPNEAGKTTLMNFLRTMFYGFTSDRRTRYLPPVYGGKPGGSIRVTGPGGGYEITRRAQLDESGSMGALNVTGSDGVAQGAHRLTMLLGQVDESIFTNVFAIGLRELQELSTLDDTAAADELYKLSSGLDRVSLVDVTRQLKAGRQSIVGPTLDDGQMQRLTLQREKLRDEIDDLAAQGRRWAELAALRNTQNVELEELKERIAQWEIEAKTYEVAIQARPTYLQHAEIERQIKRLNARTDVPDSAAEKLEELNLQRAEREEQVGELKDKRKALRDEARRLPLRRGVLDLANKIEAATEQTPWVNSLQKNIQRVENQIDQSKRQLIEDAQRLGVTEEDQRALLDDQEMHSMPDLSRQAINALAEPASEVRIWSTRFKQAKQQVTTDKNEAERLEAELKRALSVRGGEDIEKAMERNAETVSLLRKRIQVQDNLDKQNALKDQLEEKAIDLQCDEALPVDQSIFMAVLFIGGAGSFLWGLGNILGWFSAGGQVQSESGLLMVMVGMFLLCFGLVRSISLDKTTVSALDETEDQLAQLKKEIRNSEVERDDYERRLPPYTGSLDSRLKEAQSEIDELEELLPVQHNHQAAKERYLAARKRASQSHDSLKAAKAQWQRMLKQLGLAESLSPRSIRVMAEGYDSLLQTRRRLLTLEEELDTRKLELGAITQRIDSLAQQALAASSASDVVENARRRRKYLEEQQTQETGEFASDEYEEVEYEDSESADYQDEELTALAQTLERTSVHTEETLRADSSLETRIGIKADVEAGNHALDQLTKLNALVASQEQYVHQKRALKEQDTQLAKQCAVVLKAIDKIDRIHSAVLTEHGFETEDQLLAALEIKHQHEELVVQLEEFAERIQAVIAGSVAFETIEDLMATAGGEDLEQRWTMIGQRTQQAQERVDQLLQRQGELSQEMKSLASNGRLAEARLELSCIENQLKACAEHWQTLAVTTGLLDRVCEVYEAERQPETLREASAFLTQLTEGKYVRIWTPLGKNQLRIDSAKGQALPLEVLSRGTREAVFIALRLSLAAAYARRGVTIPLVLDDVLVNFDSVRAESAAKVLRDFASLGHQVVMFTCHEHIMKIFHNIGVQVRVLPTQGEPGEAEIYYPTMESEPVPVVDPEPVFELEPEPEPTPIVEIKAPSPKPTKQVRRLVVVDQEPEIDWLWYERNPDSVDWGWVEASEKVDESTLPPDLWWHRASHTLTGSPNTSEN